MNLNLTKWFQLVSGEPLPGSLVVEEQNQIVRLGVRVRQTEHVLGRHWDGDTIVEVSSPWHLGVDDESRVPGVASTLGPGQVQRLESNVGGAETKITLIIAVTLTLLLTAL